MAVERTNNHLKISIPLMNLAEELDDRFWDEYQDNVHPDDRAYYIYQQWLCLKIKSLETKSSVAELVGDI